MHALLCSGITTILALIAAVARDYRNPVFESHIRQKHSQAIDSAGVLTDVPAPVGRYESLGPVTLDRRRGMQTNLECREL